MRRLSTVLVIVALVAGMVGCVGGDGNNGDGSYTLIVDFTAGGAVTVDDVPIPGRAILAYDAGAVVSVVVVPDAGYRFTEWTGNATTIDDASAASTTITVDGDYSITANFEEEEEVHFPDANLEAAIREAIDKHSGPIYRSDLEGLTHLHAHQSGIADLTGVEYCTNLIQLSPWGNQISDISPLTNLTNLTELDLGDNHIDDISPIVNLTKLTWLSVWDNQISDISPLANLTSLTELGIWGNQISDISPLVENGGLSEGDKVCLKGNPLSSDSINVYIPQLQARGVTVNY